jgi:hypothetical protein
VELKKNLVCCEWKEHCWWEVGKLKIVTNARGASFLKSNFLYRGLASNDSAR